MSRLFANDERQLSDVPAWVLGSLAVALAAQIAWQSVLRPRPPSGTDLPPPPSAEVLRLAGFGEAAALARIAMVWLQAFDAGGANQTPYQRLDYARLVAWLRAILAVDPRSGYPLFSAARVYADNADPVRMRRMLDFVFEEFARDPNRRWPALAHAALLAKHRLNDLELARRYAAAIQQQANDPTVPDWARQMEIFILEDMNELDAAKVMLGGLLATGRIRDAEERRFLQGRLEQIEEKLKSAARPESPKR